MSTLKVISLDDEASPVTHVARPTLAARSPVDLQRELEGARATIVTLERKLEERQLELERETALRKLLHRQHEDLTAAKSQETSQQNREHQVERKTDSDEELWDDRSSLTRGLEPKVKQKETSQEELEAALKEKEDALGRVRELEKRFGEVGGTKLAEGKTLQELIDKVRSAKGSRRLRENGSALVAGVRALREDEQQNIRDKIQMLTGERDAALAKKRGFEAEITRLQRQLEMTETEYKLVDKTRVKALQAQLQAAINEKDMWQQKAAKFEDTCETLRVLSCLQRSLSKEDDIKRKYDMELQKSHAEKVAMTEQLEQAFQERNHVVRERNQLIHERNALALQAQQEYERAERFQRLVLVLRKKAMAASSVGIHAPASPSRDQSHELVYTQALQK